MVTLGLDMSTKKSGYSLFYDTQLIEYGLWEDDSENWRDRIIFMTNRLNDYINKYNIDNIYVEDVPLNSANPQTLKMLSALQGAVLSVCATNKKNVEFIPVSTWRSSLGLFNGTRKGTEREEMKKSSIDYANKTFDLRLIWKSKTSKYNQDDIADAINVAWSKIKPKIRGFGRR